MAYSNKEIIEKIEAEVRIKKPKVLNSKRSAFLNSNTFDCQDCYNVITAYQNPIELIFANALTGYTNTVQMPSGYGAQGHIAKFDNTFWINVGAIINEFTIGANCNITHVRTIDISSLSSIPVGAWEVAGLCAMDMNTLIIGTFIDINDNEGVHLLDITPGVQPSTTHLFYHGLIPNHPGGPIAGDIAYLPASNTVVTITGTSNSTFTAYHHDMSGGLLGSSLVVTNPLQTGAAGPFNAWSFDDKAYLSTVNNPGSQNYVTYEFDLTSYTLIPHTPTVIGYGDAASSPSPCAQPSGECYDIGDTGPEGGTIFAVPLGHPQNNGVNQTNFYYEVAKNDIAIGGTPSAGFNLTCGEQAHPFSAGMRVGPFSGGSAQGWGTVSLSTASALNVGDEIDWLYLPPGTTIIAIVLGSSSGILYFSNPFDWAALPVSPSGAGSPFLPPSYAGFGYYNTVGNWIPNQVNTSVNSTDYPFPTFTPQSSVSSGWTASGAEWGVHNKPNIMTSWDFGTGHKNTDEIDAYPLSPGNPTGGIHPWLDTHDIAATICKQHPSAKDDWFLPSRDEFREMVDASVLHGFNLGLNTSTQSSENYYWTSSHRLPPSTVLPDPHKYAWAYNTVTDNLELAYRCHALSVRPIRRFECEVEPDPVDEGITYDWRTSFSSGGTPGSIQLIEPSIGPGNSFITHQHTTKAYMFNALNQSTNSGSTVIFSTTQLVFMVDSNTITSSSPVQSPPQLLSIGDSLNDIGGIPYSQFGPVTDVIDIATHPLLGSSLSSYQSATGDNVDTFLVFDQSNMTAFNGPNGSWIGQNYPVYSFVDDIEWNIQTVHPLYSPQVFPGGYEIGHPTLFLGCARWDVAGNDMRQILCMSNTGNNTSKFQGVSFNIKYYNQFEELIGDWDYKLVNANNYVPCGGCPYTLCLMYLDMRLISTNFIEPTLQSSINPNVLSTAPYWGDPSYGGEGHGYMSLTCNDQSLQWNQSLTRGNSLNLENWLGTGINNRALNPSNPFYTGVSPDWNAAHNRFGWGVICRPCGGNWSYCTAVGISEYLGEIHPYPTACISFTGPFTVNYPSYGYQLGQGWIDASNAGCGGSSGPQSKLIGPSENYPDDINQCFEEGVKEIDIHAFPQTQYDESTSKRQRFVNDKKPKETGPFGIAGYYPLYDTIEAATYNSPTPIESRTGEDTYGYHIHDFGGQEYYMPNGLKIGVTQFHGDYNGQIIPQTIVEPEVMEMPEIIETPEIFVTTPPPIITEPEEEPEQTYTPPTTPRPRGSGGGGGY